MKFKNYLESISEVYTNTYEELISSCSIPVTSKMMDRLGYSYDEEEVNHLTNFKKLEDLIKIQGTKKSISCFTKGSKELSNLPSWPNVLVKLKGTVLIDSPSDMWTYVDKQGRRWISLVSSSERKISKQTEELKFFIEGIRNKILIKYDISINDRELANNLRNIDGKTKSKIIREYIDNVEKYIQKGGYKALSNHFKNDITYGYNELIVENFSIIGVYKISDSFLGTKKEDIENLGLKYLGEISNKEIEKI